MRGIGHLKSVGWNSINTTVTKDNLHSSRTSSTWPRTWAAAWHFFLLVPTGRAAESAGGHQRPGVRGRAQLVLRLPQDHRRCSSKATCAPTTTHPAPARQGRGCVRELARPLRPGRRESRFLVGVASASSPTPASSSPASTSTCTAATSARRRSRNLALLAPVPEPAQPQVLRGQVRDLRVREGTARLRARSRPCASTTSSEPWLATRHQSQRVRPPWETLWKGFSPGPLPNFFTSEGHDGYAARGPSLE
jgi:hypothetical protein